MALPVHRGCAISVTAPLIAWLIWRKAGFGPRLAVSIRFAVSALAHVEYFASNLISAKPDAWFGMSQGAAGLLLSCLLCWMWAALVFRRLRRQTAADAAKLSSSRRVPLISFWCGASKGRPDRHPHPAKHQRRYGSPGLAAACVRGHCDRAGCSVVMWLFARKSGLWVGGGAGLALPVHLRSYEHGGGLF